MCAVVMVVRCDACQQLKNHRGSHMLWHPQLCVVHPSYLHHNHSVLALIVLGRGFRGGGLYAGGFVVYCGACK